MKECGKEKTRNEADSVPLFHTHHAPVGAWASLTFGSPYKGVSIDFQEPQVKDSGTLLLGMADENQVHTIGFTEREETKIQENGDRECPKTSGVFDGWNLYPPEAIHRTLTLSKDIYRAGRLTFTVHTPCPALPDPKLGAIPELFCLPGIVMDLEVDNTEGTSPCTAFFGLVYHELKKISVFRGAESCQLRYRNDWAFAAENRADIFPVQGGDALARLRKGEAGIHQNGPAFLGMRVPAGEKKVLTVAWAVCAEAGSNGALDTTYYYRRYFRNLTEAVNGVLKQAPALRQLGKKTDSDIGGCGQDRQRFLLLCQAVRAYYACSQLLEEENGTVHWNTCEGAYLWRNTMDLCADHLFWELKRNPWVVRSMMDDFLTKYSYRDKVVFPGKTGEYEGGLTFTHDMGCYFSYSEPGCSAYERSNDSRSGFYFYMTSEQLLNGIYCMAGYVLTTGDFAWLHRYDGLLADLMSSLEHRDAPDTDGGDGILKAVSVRSGACLLESTTYDSLDPSLMEAAGSLYQLVKLWCSLLLLQRCAERDGDTDTKIRAEAMLQKCRTAVKRFRTTEQAWLKANLHTEAKSAVSAVIEPLALPFWLGVLEEAKEPDMFAILRSHGKACLEPGICVDQKTGGLRLSSTSNITWTSKAALTLFGMETVLKIPLPDSLMEELAGWAQKSARDTTISDQIHADSRKVIGGMYYPRIAAAAVWMI